MNVKVFTSDWLPPADMLTFAELYLIKVISKVQLPFGQGFVASGLAVTAKLDLPLLSG